MFLISFPIQHVRSCEIRSLRVEITCSPLNSLRLSTWRVPHEFSFLMVMMVTPKCIFCPLQQHGVHFFFFFFLVSFIHMDPFSCFKVIDYQTVIICFVRLALKKCKAVNHFIFCRHFFPNPILWSSQNGCTQFVSISEALLPHGHNISLLREVLPWAGRSSLLHHGCL